MVRKWNIKRKVKTFIVKSLMDLPVVAAQVAFSPFVLLWDSLGRNKPIKKYWGMRFVSAILIGSALLYYALSLPQSNRNQWLDRRQTDFAPIGGVPYAELINKYAKDAGLSPRLIAAVIQTESSFNPSAVSNKGAKGLMQIMPGTWSEVMAESRCSAQHPPPARDMDCIYDPSLNIAAGTRYLSKMIKACGNNVGLGLIAYNGGLGNVDYVKDRIVKGDFTGESAMYVAKVYSAWDRYESLTAGVNPNYGAKHPMVRYILALNSGLWLVALIRIGIKVRRKI